MPFYRSKKDNSSTKSNNTTKKAPKNDIFRHNFIVSVYGDTQAGKSCFLQSTIDGEAMSKGSSIPSTIGVDFHMISAETLYQQKSPSSKGGGFSSSSSKQINSGNNLNLDSLSPSLPDFFNPECGLSVNKNLDLSAIKLQIWDCAGQLRFQSIVTSYMRGGKGFILCFDVNDEASLDNLKNVWYPEILRNKAASGPIVLVGTKCDLLPSFTPREKADQFVAGLLRKDIHTSSPPSGERNLADLSYWHRKRPTFQDAIDEFADRIEALGVFYTSAVELNFSQGKLALAALLEEAFFQEVFSDGLSFGVPTSVNSLIMLARERHRKKQEAAEERVLLDIKGKEEAKKEDHNGKNSDDEREKEKDSKSSVAEEGEDKMKFEEEKKKHADVIRSLHSTKDIITKPTTRTADTGSSLRFLTYLKSSQSHYHRWVNHFSQRGLHPFLVAEEWDKITRTFQRQNAFSSAEKKLDENQTDIETPSLISKNDVELTTKKDPRTEAQVEEGILSHRRSLQKDSLRVPVELFVYILSYLPHPRSADKLKVQLVRAIGWDRRKSFLKAPPTTLSMAASNNTTVTSVTKEEGEKQQNGKHNDGPTNQNDGSEGVKRGGDQDTLLDMAAQVVENKEREIDQQLATIINMETAVPRVAMCCMLSLMLVRENATVRGLNTEMEK